MRAQLSQSSQQDQLGKSRTLSRTPDEGAIFGQRGRVLQARAPLVAGISHRTLKCRVRPFGRPKLLAASAKGYLIPRPETFGRTHARTHRGFPTRLDLEACNGVF